MAIDRSTVPPQGAYLARNCPVVGQLDVLQPSEPLEATDFQAMLADHGIEHEASLFEVILAHHPDGVDADEDEDATVAAIEARVPIILSPRLPVDEAGRRVGKPDILIASPAGGYRPVDVKSHKVLEPRSSKGSPAAVCLPENLAYEAAVPDEAFQQVIPEKDRMQLAHYQRILEAHGWKAKDGRIAAILGSEGLCVWIDLDQTMKRTPSKSQRTKMRSAMERYDFEFDFRLDIIATAQQHLEDPRVPLLVEPIKCADCTECRWRDHCLPILEERQDPSLLPDLGVDQRLAYGRAGIQTQEELAHLDPLTASLVKQDVDVTELLEIAENYTADTPLDDDKTMRRRKGQLKTLASVGITTFGQAKELLCRRTARVAHGRTPRQIEEARAAVGPSPVYLRRGIDPVHIPRADVEIDIDMENTFKPAITYLWGALVQGHPEEDQNRYHHFAGFADPTPELEAKVSGDFFDWLNEMIRDCEQRGLSLKIYCYHSPAESTALRRFASAVGREDEVEGIIRSDHWVDMKEVFKDQFIIGTGVGLKKVAVLAGYEWDAQDPGGAESMLKFVDAVRSDDEAQRQEAVDWLLRYNRGDVEATAQLRDWLTENAESIPLIEELDEMFAQG